MNKSSVELLKVRIALAFLLIAALSIDSRAQQPKTPPKKPDTHPVAGSPKPLPSDSVVEERLVTLALQGPQYDVTMHQIKIGEYAVKTAKKSWFNLLAVSFNFNQFNVPGLATQQQQQYAYVYPKYFFGLTIPVGTIISKSTEIKAAREALKITRDTQEILARSIRADILTKWHQYQSTKALLDIETSVSVEFQTAATLAESQYKQGTTTLQLYSEAIRSNSIESAKLVTLQLQRDMYRIQIEQVIGVSLDSVIQ
jgi:outer membrane protein TolC